MPTFPLASPVNGLIPVVKLERFIAPLVLLMTVDCHSHCCPLGPPLPSRRAGGPLGLSTCSARPLVAVTGLAVPMPTLPSVPIVSRSTAEVLIFGWSKMRKRPALLSRCHVLVVVPAS